MNIDQARQRAEVKMREVIANREEILTAFIAKYACEPDEIEQITTTDAQGNIHWSVRKKPSIIQMVN